jgi:NADH-quinone oxidoreductase subunit C
MTVALSGLEVGKKIEEHVPDAVSEAVDSHVVVRAESLFQVAEHLKSASELDFNYLNYISAVDYFDYFELVYQLTSLSYNHSVVLKVRCYDRERPSVPSIVSLWRGADFQEREIYDLMGIGFAGHPNLKRIVLWEGFEGHPLRKDYL